MRSSKAVSGGPLWRLDGTVEAAEPIA